VTRADPTYRREVELSKSPIFVIGAPRSGKTTLAWALAAHSELWTSAETQILPPLFGEGRLERLVERQLERPTPTWLSKQEVDRDELFSYLGLGANALFTSRSEGKRWIDHTPDHTFMVDTLLSMFPDALVVHVIRDGRLTVQAMLDVENKLDPERAKAMREGNFLPVWTTDFGKACTAWATSVTAGTDACARHPGRCQTVTLDELGADPEATLRRTLEFVGVADEPGPHDSWRWQARKRPPDPMTGREQWEDWSPEQRATFASEAGAVLVSCGLATESEMSQTATTEAGRND
jgi:hypothetical protein